METTAMPIMMALRTRYVISQAVRTPPQNIPIQSCNMLDP
jgi:hypothetical protein